MLWNKKSLKKPKNYLELEKILLENRDIKSLKDKKSFFSPVPPNDLTLKSVEISEKNIHKAVELIIKTIRKCKKIVIFGDYDADGICASAILWESLFNTFLFFNSESKNFPVPFIPHREKHGYGITVPAIDEIIKKHNPDLIITVDNGIVAHEAIEYAKNKNVTIIVTDHHQPEYKNDKEILLPKADCIVHSTKLCGASVAWILVREIEILLKKENSEFMTTFEKSLDLAGIATIADQVLLFNANRSFAKFGIEALRATKRVGIKKLLTIAGIEQEKITEWNIGFGISPRINAMGRLEHGLDALRLLCTKSTSQAQKFAQLLSETNKIRQDLTKSMIDDAKIQVKDLENENIIIVFSNEYHEGILGLIAGGLTETYNKPSIAISLSGEFAKASARSIPGVNIVNILRQLKDDLLSVGGHPMAAGFSFELDKLDFIMKKIFLIAKKEIKREDLQKFLRIDCEIDSSLIEVSTVESLSTFGPFGMGNPQPQVLISDLQVLEVKKIGKEHNHLKLKLISDDKKSFDVIGWSMADYLKDILVGSKVSIVGILGINQWGNKYFVQILLKDLINC